MAGSFISGMAGLAGSLLYGMAGSLISGFIEKAKDKLSSLVLDEFGLLWGGVKEDLEKLSSQYSTIQSVLEDAEKKQATSAQVKDWLRKLKDVAYDADDVLDEFATEALRWKVQGRIQTRKRKEVCGSDFSYLSSPHSVVFQREMAHKIKEIMKRLDEVAKERHDLHLHEGLVVRQPEIKYRTPTISLIEESEVFGRGKEKEELVNMLVSEGSRGTEVSVIPIVGMGGLGKTTLAQLVYNDEIVQKQFEIRAWVCVSDDFDLVRITKEIVVSVCKETPSFYQLNLLVEHLQTKLHQKKFLLVLDDVWNEDPADWDVLRAPLTYGAKGGSKIIVTTRSHKVAAIMGTDNCAYHLSILSNEHCLELFRKRAFADECHDKHESLDAIGKKIVKKCGGVPLAVRTLGGLLQSTREANDWNYILESKLWELQQKENKIMPLLRLSYDCLPSHLKQCLGYCSIFPKDFIFDKERLVKMWMGAGFIRSDGGKEMEDIGRGYFNDLLWRSFFQHESDDWEGQPIYKMHDLIHDVTQLVSKGECFRLEDGRASHFPAKARYSSLICTKDDQTISESFYECKSLRNLILLLHDQYWFKEPTISLNPDKIFQQLRCIRVLDLSRTKIKKLPHSIGHLKHLRYLDLSHTLIQRLPASVSSLYNLQTLNLIGCRKLCELPHSIGDLKHLRYLDLSHTLIQRLPASVSSLYNLQTLNLLGCWKLCELPKDTRNLINLRHLAFPEHQVLSMPRGIGMLTCLQTLSGFIVGKESGNEIEQLKKLNNLRGGLSISQLQNVVNAKDAELKNKQCIDSLELRWFHGLDDLRDDARRVEEEILESLQPHTNLKELKISEYYGDIFPSWMLDRSLSNLKTITLDNCGSCKILPSLGQLPCLENLTVHRLGEVRCIGREFCGDGMVRAFPLLKILEINFMSTLEEWCGVEEGDFPCLEELRVWDCKSLTALPRLLLPSLRKLDMSRCNDKILLSSLPYLTSLSELRITEFEKLQVIIPSGLIESLTQLKELTISDCKELVSLVEDEGWKHLHSLKYLFIFSCPKLTFLPEPEYGLPTTLKLLIINGCVSVTSLPSGLQNLDYFAVYSSELTSLPEGLKNLTSLRSLFLSQCPNLATIPEEGLPTTLQSLLIDECPLLAERCRKECFQDWSKISHIPKIIIDGKCIS